MEISIKLLPLQENKEVIDHAEYRSVVGALNYLAIVTRPDITFATGIVARFVHKPGLVHWQAVKRILRYLKGTADYGLIFKRNYGADNLTLDVYCDADWAGDIRDRKSTSGFLVKYRETAVDWKTGKQGSVTLSTLETEYIGTATATKEVIWLRRLIEELGFKQLSPTTIKIDNEGARQLANNHMVSSRTKHIDIRYHFI